MTKQKQPSEEQKKWLPKEPVSYMPFSEKTFKNEKAWWVATGVIVLICGIAVWVISS